MANWVIEPFDRSHQRAEFSCGKAPLDHFLHSLVSQYDKRRLGKTYVAVRVGEKRVVGYYTLASGTVAFADVPKALAKKPPKHPLPTVLLGRLAVDQSVHGQGLGAFLLGDAAVRALDLSKKLGIHAVDVVAIDAEAKAFYEKFAFMELLDNPFHLLLPIEMIEDAVKGS